MSAFDRLHPALQHHIVNSLGWSALRPLQEEAIEPLLAGEHALLLAPTAGGKTEAAFFPVLSRMIGENWHGTSIVYVCPIKALLNNLEHRLAQYAGLVGRTVQLWHGDVTLREKSRAILEPPDILLTTPESIEVLLVSKDRARRELFGATRVVIVDELHAFAGDDRGWHLLAVLERAQRIAGREFQRIGLSATIGNPDDLLEWLAASSEAPRRVIAPEVAAEVETDVGLDYVGTLANAATVIARLHRGEKRLVFCDSRARVEELAALLRQREVETFVSHSSLSLDERRRAEAAFAEGSNCVIVATSTLELGIDVGDLDRVIQIDAPGTVSSFLQRLGRTGRRSGASRNCLFLATTDDALLQAAALLLLWGDGYVEPIEPPPDPFHLFAQQILALALQEGRIGRHDWERWVGRMPAFQRMARADTDAILDHMVQAGILFDDDGLLSIGVMGEVEYGRKNFLDLFSIFQSPPLFTVLHGRKEIGRVHPMTFFVPNREEQPVLTLGGRYWRVTNVDWNRQVAQVTPADVRGRSRWLGTSAPLSFDLCQAMKRVLAGQDPPAKLSERAASALAELRQEFDWVRLDETTITWVGDKVTWWTFAGLRANAQLASLPEVSASATSRDRNLAIEVSEPGDVDVICRVVEEQGAEALKPVIDERSMEEVKFGGCLPDGKLLEMLVRRWSAGGKLDSIVSVAHRVRMR